MKNSVDEPSTNSLNINFHILTRRQMNNMSQDKDKWPDLVITVTNLRVPFLYSCYRASEHISF